MKKILAVEDNPANMAYLVFLLKRLKIEVVKASSGEDGLEILEKEEVDGMLVDINLGPGITGVQVMENIRENTKYRKLPIVAVTAYYGGGLDKELVEKGFSAFLAKPFSLDQLKEVLNKFSLIVND